MFRGIFRVIESLFYEFLVLRGSIFDFFLGHGMREPTTVLELERQLLAILLLSGLVDRFRGAAGVLKHIVAIEEAGDPFRQ